MQLVAPDPRLGIAPDRIARVRSALDAVPSAGGVAVALPGGPDGALDALVLRPDGVLGLHPAVVRRGAPQLAGVAGSSPAVDPLADTDAGHGSGPGGGSLEGGSHEGGASEEAAASELDRLLGLADPAPTAPRQVVPLPADVTDPDGRAAPGVRLALGAAIGPAVLSVAEVRRLFAAWRLAEHVPDADALARAGFPEAGGAGADAAPVVPAARTATGSHPSFPSTGTAGRASASHPGSAPTSGASSGPVSGPHTAGGSGPAPLGVGAAEGGPPNAPVPPTAPVPVADPRPGTGHLGALASDPGSGLPATGRLPGYDPSSPPRRRTRSRGPSWAGARGSVPAWVGTWRGLAVAATAAFLVALGAALLVAGGAGEPPTAAVTADPGTTRTVDGVPWTRQVATSEPTCEGHAYGLAAQFLRERSCVRLDRTLWSGSPDPAGGPAVVAVAVVQMGDVSSAAALKSLIDSSGTGNVSDLLREGRGYPGAPSGLSGAGYGSTQIGDRVVIAETDWVDTSRTDEPALDRLARRAVDGGLGQG